MMEISKMMADRMILDLRSNVLALVDAALSLQHEDEKIREHGKKVLEKVTKNIEIMLKEYHMIESYNKYYNLDVKPEKLKQSLDNINEGEFEQALNMLNKLNVILKRGLSERFSKGIESFTSQESTISY